MLELYVRASLGSRVRGSHKRLAFFCRVSGARVRVACDGYVRGSRVKVAFACGSQCICDAFLLASCL